MFSLRAGLMRPTGGPSRQEHDPQRPTSLRPDTEGLTFAYRWYLDTLGMQALQPRLTRDERKAQTRERLVETAHAMFLQRGYHATSLEEIAAELALTKGSVYAN